LHDQRAVKNLGQVLVILIPGHLVQRFCLDSLRPDSGKLFVNIHQPIHDNVLSLFDRDHAVLLAKMVQGIFRFLDIFPELCELFSKKVPRFLRNVEPAFQNHLDKRSGVTVG
jgi:hypothetical protein